MKKGFTLIELLVVIAIIGMISSIVFASLNKSTAQARDARRKEDFHQIELALALYYSQNGAYPATGSATAIIQGSQANSSAANWTTLLATPLINAGTIASVPKDPINVGSGCFMFPTGGGACSVPPTVNSVYHYRSNGTSGGSDATVYLLCTWLENHSDSETLQYRDIPDPFTPGNYIYANDGYSAYGYCVRSPN